MTGIGIESLQTLPLLVFRAVADAAGFTVVAVGGGLPARLGAPADAVVAWLEAAIHPADQSAFTNPSKTSCRIRLRGAEGGWLWHELRAVAIERTPGCVRYAGLLTDAADLVAAEEAAQRYRDYCTLSSDWYWETDADHRFTHFSREFEAITGVTGARVLGKTRWETLREPDLGGADWEAHISAVQAGQAFRNFEYPSRRADGGIIWYRVSGRPRRDAQGRFLGHFGVASDVTAERRIHAQLQHAERLAALGQLAAGVAHEINNPLGFVRSNLGALDHYLRRLVDLADAYAALAADPASEAAAASLDAAKADADLDFLRADAAALLAESRDGLDRVGRIVADLRDFAREGDSAWRETALEECIESALKLCAGQFGDRIRVERRYTPGLPAILAQPGLLNQVFLALLTNAAQAIGPASGVVTLSTGRGEGGVWIEIADTGVGIAPDRLPHIFEPFFTTRPVGQGTGMGLSTSYGIVSQHGGRIEVSSAPGAGTRFRVALPLRPPGSGPA